MTALAFIYRERALAQVPRILGLMDRRAESPTFGCADRAYWHYLAADFPNARFQEAVHLLALVHTLPIGTHPFSGKPQLIEWANASAVFWAGRRHRDGSADEAYPFERSLCATAFSLLAVGEAWARLSLSPQPAWERSARWLAAARPSSAANQSAAAALALAVWAELTRETRWRKASDAYAAAVMAQQSADGWYPEYGGPDAGYQSLTLSLLARLWRRTQDAALKRSLDRAAAWIDGAIGPTGQVDPAANSRQTSFLYPCGLAILGSPALARHAAGIEQDKVLHPGWLDDRYVIQLATDYLLAAEASA